MKILVTGIEGYVGSLLVSLLMQRGYKVVGLDKGFDRVNQLDRGAQSTVKILKRNIQNITAEDLAGAEAVVHMVELSNSSAGQMHPYAICGIHYQDSIYLANVAKTAGVRRFVYLSSCSVYGAGTDEYVTEDSPVNPQTAYATCKALVEKEIGEIADDNFSPTFLRKAIAFGASPQMRFDVVLNKLAGLAWTTKEVKIPRDGTSWRPLVHVLDICKAILCTLEAPRDMIHNHIFNVGDTAHNYQLQEIAAIVSEVFKAGRLSFERTDSSYINHRVSFEKINKLLPDFKCDWDAQRGAQQLLSFFTLTDTTAKSHFLSESLYRQQQQKHLVHAKSA